MRFVQEFQVEDDVKVLWKVFEQPEVVAECMPGVESIQVIDPDTFIVVITQKVGPISATFDARVVVTERVENHRISFSATGKAVRGAIGNFRAESVVTLHPRDGASLVRVESEAALAGVLGSIGQKIISKQAEKITEQFAANLQARLNGTATPSAAPQTRPVSAQYAPTRAGTPTGPVLGGTVPAVHAPAPAGDTWSKAAVVLGLVNVMISLAILLSLN